jgi:hypothetical protein
MRAQPIFQAANDLPFVFEGLCMLDAEFEGEEGDGHSFEFQVSSFEYSESVRNARPTRN